MIKDRNEKQRMINLEATQSENSTKANQIQSSLKRLTFGIVGGTIIASIYTLIEIGKFIYSWFYYESKF